MRLPKMSKKKKQKEEEGETNGTVAFRDRLRERRHL